jgi:hypothetical protein
MRQCTLVTRHFYKAPEVVAEAPFRSSANEEAIGHGAVPSDSHAQPGDSDTGHASYRTGKPTDLSVSSII